MPRSTTARLPIGPAKPRVPNLLMRVWDAPVRLFHWTVSLLILFSYVSITQGWMQLHFLSGYTILTLLLFRLAWGFVGSDTARFRQFLRSPIAGLAHLRAIGKREPDTEIGHNAAGGWMVLALLAAIATQVGTGLFSNQDGFVEGPLAHHVSGKTSDWITGIHGQSFWVLAGFIALHVVAITVYLVIKRQNLVTPMLTGRKRLPATMQQPRFASPVLALGVLAVAASLVAAMVRFG